jgi:hypothetical protein
MECGGQVHSRQGARGARAAVYVVGPLAAVVEGAADGGWAGWGLVKRWWV